MCAARALLGIDQKQLVGMSGVSQLTTQRMEASEGNVRGVVHTLTKIVECAGIDLTGDNARSESKDAVPASRTQTHHRAITHYNQKQKLPDGGCLLPDDPSIQAA
jgi:transcriptional regulator with XRE-family HTH domain